MNKSALLNIMKLIGTKVPQYEVLANEKGWYKLPYENGWRDKDGNKQGYWENYVDGINLLLPTTRFIKSKGNYVDGIKQGRWVDYYSDGKNKHFEENYVNGIKDGKWIEYWENGNKKIEGNYVNGKEEGEWIYYWDNGNKKIEGNIVNGKLEGKWIYYNEDGTVRNIEYYG